MEVCGGLSVDPVERNGANEFSKEKLPHDLVIEILSWLHIKHLWPLRCVSKAWLYLIISNPQFAKLQFDRFLEINNNHPDPSIIGSPYRSEGENDSNLVLAPDFMSCDKAFLVQFPFYQSKICYSLCGISNGLLCICSRQEDKEVYIWNPLFINHITIPCLPAPSIRFPSYRASTKFEFGFVRDSNVYKVVRLFDETDFDEDFGEVHDTWRQISVYTIGVDSMWRTVQVDLRLHPLGGNTINPLVNGCLHWRGKRLETDSWDLIVTFDLKEEVISEFLLPDGIEIEEIVELSGFLCAIDRKIEEEETHIWVMKEYGVVSSWSKQCVVGKPEGFMPFYYLHALGVAKNGEIILTSTGVNWVLYNPETNIVQDIKGFPAFSAYAFLASIISPTEIS